MKSFKTNYSPATSVGDGLWVIERRVPAKVTKYYSTAPMGEGEHIHTLRGRPPSHTSRRNPVAAGYTQVEEWKWEEIKACDDPLKADELARLYKRSDTYGVYRVWDRENNVEWKRYDGK